MFQFQKWNSSACSPYYRETSAAQNIIFVSIPEVEFLSLLLAGKVRLPASDPPGFQFQKWNSSACSRQSRRMAESDVIPVSIPEVEFLSLLQKTMMEKVEKIKQIGFNSRSGIPQLAPIYQSL